MELSRVRLNPGRVVEAALALVDAEGLDQLSMRKLGAALGVEAMSLYKHVPNKQALLAQMRAQLVSRVTVEGSVVGWKGLLGALARAAHQLLATHPNAAPLFASATFADLCPPMELERLHRRMREMGFNDSLRELTLRTVSAYVMGCFFGRDTETQAFDAGLELVLEGVEAVRRRSRN